MKINSLLMDEKDNVVTCTEEIPAGTFAAWLREDGTAACVKATEDILYCHKIAVRPVKKGSDVIKYGQSIGRATADIPEGAWVSHENIFAGPRDYGSELIPLAGDGSPLPDAAKSFSWGGDPGDPEKTASALEGLGLTRDPETGEVKFLGYRRAEGRSGIRNHVLILPTCSCASESCRIAASQVNGAVNIIFNTGCSDVEENTAMSQKILTGFALNPNVFGVATQFRR